MNPTPKHPIQPLVMDGDVIRFKRNAIVRFLLDNGPHDMNSLAVGDFSQEDREQFAQLIGYSLSGFSELGYVSEETYGTAEIMAESLNGIGEGEADEKDARIAHLQTRLDNVREGMKLIVPELFRIHPDDLTE